MSIATKWAQAIKDHDFLERLACDHDCMEVDASVFTLMREPRPKAEAKP